MSEHPERPADRVEAARARLREAEIAGDEERLQALQEIYASLEAELDRDVDEAPPPGR